MEGRSGDMQSVTLLITRLPFHNGEAACARFDSRERRSRRRAGFVGRRRRTARLDDGADTFVSAFSPRAVATAPVVADT